MKKYETYKDSGLEWLGSVPVHWSSIKMKYLFSFGRGLNITKSDLVENGTPVISYGQIHSKINTGVAINDELLRYVPNEMALEHPENKVCTGDFIFADTSEDKEGCGNCVYIDREGIYAGYHSLVLDGKGRDNKYFAYLFKSEPWRIQIRSKASGVKVFSITQSIMGESTVILPTLPEQRTIAAYLDYKVGQIDALISEKEKMVDDLKAYRSSVITEAVTKGLDKNVEMKESGLEWLGMVPGNWEVLPLKHLVSEPLQYGANESADDCIISDPRYIRITDITENGDLRDSTYKTLPRSKAISYMLKKGDILFARSGATVGKTYVFKEDYDACFAGYLIKASCNKKLIPMFLYYFTSSNSYENWKNSIFNQATIQNIGADKYSILPIPLPSRSEQQKIVDYLNDKIGKIENAISEQEHQLSDLKAYKSSLITEAVTGKIDLRDWQTQKA